MRPKPTTSQTVQPATSVTSGAPPQLLWWEIALGAALASTSGVAIIAHTVGLLSLSFTAPFVVLPTAAVLSGLVLLRRRLYQRFHLFALCLLRGAIWGLVATLAYDAIRPLLISLFGFSFNPYRAMPIFGHLITGLPMTDHLAIAAGWGYHFWNGISFGMMFALLRPRGGPLAGLIWGLALQGLMMAVYPKFLALRLADPGFLMAGLIGHGLWGVVLGAGLRKGGWHA